MILYMRQLYPLLLLLLCLIYACSNQEEERILEALPSNISFAHHLDWEDLDTAFLNGDLLLGDFLLEKKAMFSAGSTIWAKTSTSDILIIQTLEQSYFDMLKEESIGESFQFGQWEVYQKELNDVIIYFSYDQGVLFIAQQAYLIESALSCLFNNQKGLVDEFPEFTLEKGTIYRSVLDLDLDIPPELIMDLNVMEFLDAKTSGVLSEEETLFYAGKINSKINHYPFKDSTWKEMLSIIPSDINYLGFHSYYTAKDEYENNVLEYILSKNKNYTYASVLMNNEIGNDDLIFILNTGKDSIPLLEDIENKYGILQERENPIFPIKRIPMDKLCSKMKILPFIPCVKNRYVSVIDEYAIFAKSEKVLEKFLEHYMVNATLRNDEQFNLFLNKRTNQTLEGSLHYFVYLAKTQQAEKEILLELIPGKKEKLSHINLYQKEYEVRNEERIKKEWVFYADALLDHPLDVVPYHDTRLIVFQDTLNILYWISEGGTLIKFLKLDGSLKSKVHHYQDKTTRQDRYIFNTSNKIYILDEELDDIHDFPISLSSPATNGLAMIDIPNTRSIYGFIACENGNYYGYDIGQGLKPMPSWNPLIGTGALGENMTILNGQDEIHFSFLNKDMEFISLNRKTENRFNPMKIEKEFYNKIHIDNHVKGKERFVLHNGKGRLKIINTKGETFDLVLDKESNEGQFLLLDIMNNEQKEYVYLTPENITVYGYVGNDFKTLRVKNNHEGIDEIFEVEIDDNKSMLGGINKKKNKVYLFDELGEVVNGFPVAGDQVFTMFNLEGNKKVILTSLENRVVSYVLTE